MVSATPIHEIPKIEGYWYLGTPYSKYPGGLDLAFIAAAELTGKLLRAGVIAYSPIAHSHPVAVYAKIDPYDYDVWIPANQPLMDAAHGLIVGMLPGWESSKGLKFEINYFYNENCEIYYVGP